MRQLRIPLRGIPYEGGGHRGHHQLSIGHWLKDISIGITVPVLLPCPVHEPSVLLWQGVLPP